MTILATFHHCELCCAIPAHYARELDALAWRIAQILCPSRHFEPYFNTDTDKWHLDSGNDWWMGLEEKGPNEGKIIEIRGRYSQDWTENEKQALKTTIEKIVFNYTKEVAHE